MLLPPEPSESENAARSARVQFLARFDFANYPESGSTTYSALFACLSPDDACELFDTRFLQGSWLSRVALRKIGRDMQRTVLPAHRGLLVKLEAGIESLPGSKRTSAANALLSLAEALPRADEHLILEHLSHSPNGNIRKQVYRRLKEFPDEVCPDYLLNCWATYRDFEAARLLLFRAPEEFLLRSLTELDQHFVGQGSLLSRLYIRVAEQDPEVLKRLLQLDPIAYAYVCTQLKIRLPADQLVSIYRSQMLSDRVGLVVWCAGQMGLWDAVLAMAVLAEDPPKDVRVAQRKLDPWASFDPLAQDPPL